MELFVGRQDQLDRIIQRGVGQVERGKPISIFVQGEYGIGKSSIARYVQFLAAERHDWAYWTDQDLVIDEQDALAAVADATEDFGRKAFDCPIGCAPRSASHCSVSLEVVVIPPDGHSTSRAIT